MSRLMTKTAKTIRLAAFVGVLGSTAFLGYEFIQNPNKAAVVETVRTTAETGAQRLAEQTDEARKTWEHLDLDGKVNDLQDKARPMGQKITRTVGPTLNQSMQPVQEGERRMSLPALLLVLVFGTVFVLMGRASGGGGRY